MTDPSMTTIRRIVLAAVFVAACGESENTGVAGAGGLTSDASASTGGTAGSRSTGGRSGAIGRGGTGGSSGNSGTAGTSTAGMGGATGRSVNTGGAVASGGGGPTDAAPSPDDICMRLATTDAGAGATDAGGGADASLTTVSGISLTSDGLPRVTQAYIGFGASFRTSRSASAPGCTTRTVGACTLFSCVPLDQVDAAAPPATDAPPYRHAGQLRVRTVVSNPNADGTYPGVSYFGQQGFRSGDRILYCALGGDVPAFAKYLVAPGHVRVETTGSFPWSDNPAFDRTADHTLAWTAAGPGDVLLTISNTGFAGRTLPRVSVGCLYDPAGSPVTIPKEVWQDFPTGDAAMSLRTINSDVVVAGGYSVPISATYLGPSIRLRF